MLETAKGYHALGFSLLMLGRKSKRPIDLQWTKGPRASWDEFAKKHRPGFNIGVRLGPTSLINGLALMAFDCDVKSAAPQHQQEMREALSRIAGDEIFLSPTVESGRGGGSCHIYFLTSRPTRGRSLAKSKDRVAVHMPSVQATKRDAEELGQDQVDKGFRSRAAWEISLMGDGQQVVLPPSIHPDSGKPYTWAVPLDAGLVEIDITSLATDEPARPETPKGKIRLADVDLERLQVDPVIRTMIVDGVDETGAPVDRSAALMKVAIALVKAGLSDGEILSVLTDEQTALGLAAFEHRKTRDRKEAARWVQKYTLAKARMEADPSFAFPEEVHEEAPLSKAEQEKQAEEIEGLLPGTWLSRLERTHPNSGAKIKPTLFNAVEILTNGVFDTPTALVYYSDFLKSEFFLVDTPWGSSKGDEVSDRDIVLIKYWLGRHFNVEFSDNTVLQALVKIGHANARHEVRDYLKSLVWDGVPRAAYWLRDYAGADMDPVYLEAVSTKVLVAMCKRVFEPGSKFDEVLILEGGQGKRKSTLVMALGAPWSADASLDVQSKDSVEVMRGKWVIELGELSTLSRSELTVVKQFISRPTDRMRPAYGRRASDFPRQCVFIGTTNEEEYLKDPTGDRRFWPVEVDGIDIDGFKAVRDQLFAEAMALYDVGFPTYMFTPEERSAAARVQGEKAVYDALTEVLTRVLKDPVLPKEFTLSELTETAPELGMRSLSQGDTRRLGQALRKLGYSRKRVGAVRLWFKV